MIAGKFKEFPKFNPNKVNKGSAKNAKNHTKNGAKNSAKKMLKCDYCNKKGHKSNIC